jgi:two-component system cell cycle sensor histidine kinase/response regulator CckA
VALGGAPIVGGMSGAVLVLRDVTAQHEAEQEQRSLRQAFEQAQKLESVGRLAGSVAHDFNNVLTVILGNVEMALLGLSPHHPLVTPLQEMRQAAESAAALTRQLLAFSRKSVIEPQTLDLDERLEKLSGMVARLIGEDVVVQLEPGRVGRVRVDPGQLEQILINLAVNARDAMPGGGELVIRTTTERVEAGDARLAPGGEPGDYAVVEVADSGCGMTDEVKQHIFEPFFTTKERGKGTGLGLATVYGAVVQNHGFVQVDSEPGRGTIFRVHLPRVPDGEPAARPHLATPPPVPGGSETILIVEDEASVRRLATRTLQRAGYRVIACASGGDAIVAAKREPGPIHLLLSDVVMPGMDGPTLVRELAAIRAVGRVLFVSGYSGESSQALERLAQDGANVLSKPFTPATLSRAVRSALDAA